MRDSRNDMPIELENEMERIYTSWWEVAKKDLEADYNFAEYYEVHASQELKNWYERKRQIKEEAFKRGIIID